MIQLLFVHAARQRTCLPLTQRIADHYARIRQQARHTSLLEEVRWTMRLLLARRLLQTTYRGERANQTGINLYPFKYNINLANTMQSFTCCHKIPFKNDSYQAFV